MLKMWIKDCSVNNDNLRLLQQWMSYVASRYLLNVLVNFYRHFSSQCQSKIWCTICFKYKTIRAKRTFIYHTHAFFCVIGFWMSRNGKSKRESVWCQIVTLTFEIKFFLGDILVCSLGKCSVFKNDKKFSTHPKVIIFVGTIIWKPLHK